MFVVVQHAQAVLGDFGVGGINVHDIDFALGQRLISQAVIEAERLKRQRICAFEQRPPVLAVQEFLRHSQFQFGLTGKTANARNAELRGAHIKHGERVSIVESQRHRRPQAERRKLEVERGEIAGPILFQQLEPYSPGIFRINIYTPALQRRKQYSGIAQPLFVHHLLFIGTHCGLSQDFPENVGFGEALGADDESGSGKSRGRK